MVSPTLLFGTILLLSPWEVIPVDTGRRNLRQQTYPQEDTTESHNTTFSSDDDSELFGEVLASAETLLGSFVRNVEELLETPGSGIEIELNDGQDDDDVDDDDDDDYVDLGDSNRSSRSRREQPRQARESNLARTSNGHGLAKQLHRRHLIPSDIDEKKSNRELFLWPFEKKKKKKKKKKKEKKKKEKKKKVLLGKKKKSKKSKKGAFGFFESSSSSSSGKGFFSSKSKSKSKSKGSWSSSSRSGSGSWSGSGSGSYYGSGSGSYYGSGSGSYSGSGSGSYGGSGGSGYHHTHQHGQYGSGRGSYAGPGSSHDVGPHTGFADHHSYGYRSQPTGHGGGGGGSNSGYGSGYTAADQSYSRSFYSASNPFSGDSHRRNLAEDRDDGDYDARSPSSAQQRPLRVRRRRRGSRRGSMTSRTYRRRTMVV